jgi:uncharacterized membrane protein
VFGAERQSGAQAVERLTLFTDAVVAIAITLLALELPVPEGNTLSAFWSSVQRDDGHYAAFLISFVVIAAAWGTHNDVFWHARQADPRLRTLNMAWLLTIILVPFATRLLTARGRRAESAAPPMSPPATPAVILLSMLRFSKSYPGRVTGHEPAKAPAGH